MRSMRPSSGMKPNWSGGWRNYPPKRNPYPPRPPRCDFFSATLGSDVICGNPHLVDRSRAGYDCLCARRESSLRQPNRTWNDAVGRDSPWRYRSSSAVLMAEAGSFWNSALCSTQAWVGHCLRYAYPYADGRGCRWKCRLHLFS